MVPHMMVFGNETSVTVVASTFSPTLRLTKELGSTICGMAMAYKLGLMGQCFVETGEKTCAFVQQPNKRANGRGTVTSLSLGKSNVLTFVSFLVTKHLRHLNSDDRNRENSGVALFFFNIIGLFGIRPFVQ